MIDLSPEALLARRALAEKATRGEWDVVENLEDQTQCSVRIISPKHHIVLRDDWITFTDALFIVRHSPDVVMADIDEILRLRAQVAMQEVFSGEDDACMTQLEVERDALEEQVARLEKEADWLARVLANVGCGVPESEYIDMDINGMSPPASEHWREAARKAVEGQCQK